MEWESGVVKCGVTRLSEIVKREESRISDVTKEGKKVEEIMKNLREKVEWESRIKSGDRKLKRKSGERKSRLEESERK